MSDDPPFKTPEAARAYIQVFRAFTLPGTDFVETSEKRRIMLDEMTDDDALFVAAEFRRMEIEAARASARRGRRPN